MTFDPLELAKSLGSDEGPSTDMVARGYHGNGVWPSDPATMATLTETSRKKGAARRAARIEAYDEAMVGGIVDSAKLQVDLVRWGREILAECKEEKRRPTGIELDILKRAQVAAEKVPDRVIGKATQKHEHAGQVDFVGLIAGTEDISVFGREQEWIDAEVVGDDDDADDDSWSDE